MLNWKKIDIFFGKIAYGLLIACVVGILFILTYKSVVGRYMLYEDYYKEQSK